MKILLFYFLIHKEKTESYILYVIICRFSTKNFWATGLDSEEILITEEVLPGTSIARNCFGKKNS